MTWRSFVLSYFLVAAYCVAHAKPCMLRKWQRKWNESNTGRFTYEFIPNVGTNILFPVNRGIGISHCRLLLHDTMLKYDSYKNGTSSSPICDCGSGDRETTEHFLLRCSNYTAARKVMFGKN